MLFDCPPAFGFGLAKKCELSKDDRLITPGPGKYELKKSASQSAWKFGTAKRNKLVNKDVPGPGNYNVRLKFPAGPAYSISSKAGLNDKSDNLFTPGPGTYKPITKEQKNYYTFGSKYKDNSRDLTPGPGNYNLRSEKDLCVPSSIFGHEKRNELNDSSTKLSPGPGRYEYNADVVNTRHPQYSFGREGRLTKNSNDTPGPGTYQHKEYLGKEGSKISMSIKLKSSASTENVPGPGRYEINNKDLVFNKLPAIKIGTAKRFSTLNSSMTNGPGPGAYNDLNSIKNIRDKKPSWKIGTAGRTSLNENGLSSPGPGNYNISKNIGDDAPHYSMRVKDKDSKNYITPGPGRYENEKMNLYKHNPSWKIGTGKRDDALKKVIRDGYPGPGTYDSTEGHFLAAPKYGFGTQKRYKDKFNDNPGPGSYHIPCRIVDVNTYTREQGKFDPDYKFI